jgi:hypothetical protein
MEQYQQRQQYVRNDWQPGTAHHQYMWPSLWWVLMMCRPGLSVISYLYVTVLVVSIDDVPYLQLKDRHYNGQGLIRSLQLNDRHYNGPLRLTQKPSLEGQTLQWPRLAFGVFKHFLSICDRPCGEYWWCAVPGCQSFLIYMWPSLWRTDITMAKA